MKIMPSVTAGMMKSGLTPMRGATPSIAKKLKKGVDKLSRLWYNKLAGEGSRAEAKSEAASRAE